MGRSSRLLNACGAALSLALATTISGCAGLGDLQFRQDDRLRFTSPEPYELVEAPVELTWTIRDFTPVDPKTPSAPDEGAGYFAVFVDRAPVPPGRPLSDIAKDDLACQRRLDCPDAQYLAANGVHLTGDEQLTLDFVEDLDSREKVQLHEVTVVLIGADGRRIGESAWHVDFRMKRQGEPL